MTDGLDRNIPATFGLRVVFAVYGKADDVPLDERGRATFCAYVRSLLARYPSVNDVVVWHEANSPTFWRPQAGAPAVYEALLERCWDVLHEFRERVNVVTSTAASHDPGSFLRGIGGAVRASRRERPVFDTMGHHPYPEHSSEEPWARHPKSTRIAEGDLDKLTDALRDAFGGTAQPLPGEDDVRIWYLEDGFQSPSPCCGYTGRENERHAALDQGRRLADALRLASCQPGVGAFFNFELVDEKDLGGWQSGLFSADGRKKPAYDDFRAAVAEAKRGAVDCARFPAAALTG